MIRLILLCTLLMSAISSAAHGMNLIGQATDGIQISRLSNGQTAIVFEPGTPVGISSSWRLNQPLEVGWHTVEFQFSQESDSRKLVDFQCLDASGNPILSLNLYHLPSTTGSEPISRIGIHLPAAATTIRWRKNQSRSMRSAPLIGLSLKPGRPTQKSCLMEAIALTAQNGKFTLPDNLGGGHMRLVTPVPAPVRWIGNDAKSFTSPAASETAVFLAAKLAGLETSEPELKSALLERRFESPCPIGTNALPPTLMPWHGPGKIRQTIEITGSGLRPNDTALADFPGGASMAAVQSWDDGIPQDLRAAQLLQRHGWRATFFFNHHSPMVNQWQSLEDLGMEVGSHSWSHPFYPLQSPRRCRDESVMMRKFLESKVGHPVISFAYPFNYAPAYDADGDYVLRAQHDAGYLGCRSTMNGPMSLDEPGNPFILKPNAHFLAGKYQLEAEWQRAATVKRGVWYVWGHTYEIASEKDWQAFEALLSHFGRRPGVWYASQGDLMIWKHLRDATRLEVTGDSEQMTIQLESLPLHPWWANRVPMTLQVPGTIHTASLNGKPVPVANGILSLPNP